MLIEAIRLVVVLAFTAVFYRIGRSGQALPVEFGSPDTSAFVLTALGAGIGYALGGVIARGLDRAITTLETRLAQRHASEVLAGTLGLLLGLAFGALVSWPLLLLIPQTEVAYPIAAITLIAFASFGYRFSMRKRVEVFGVLGVTPVVGLDDAGCVLDSSAAIDGRVIALWKGGLLPAPICVPAFIIWELQSIADSGDASRRRRGQRGLEVLGSLREAGAPVKVIDEDPAATTDADAKLLIVARRRGIPVVTADANLARAGELQGIRMLSLHALAELVRPPVVPGQRVRVAIVREGREPGQGIGYLDDGTMVVVERTASMLGHEVDAEVTSVLQNPTGRMLFGRPFEAPPEAGDGEATESEPGEDGGPGRLRSVR